MNNTRPLIAAITLAIACVASTADAQTAAVQWTTAAGGNGHWYARIASGELNTWDAAKAGAMTIGAHLVTLSSAAEETFVRTLIGSQYCLDCPHTELAIGLSQPSGTPEPSGGWEWVTGEPVTYTNWRAGEPNNQGGTEDIAAINCSSGWNDGGQALCVVAGSLIEWSADCNSDGIVDYGQCHDGSLADANANNIPDCCEQGTSCWQTENLLVNGGLEATSAPTTCGGFTTHAPGSTVIPGWSIVGPGNIDWAWNWANPAPTCCDWVAEGFRMVDLNGSPQQSMGGALRQTVATIVGRTYQISVQAQPNHGQQPVGTTKVLRLTTGSTVTDHPFITLPNVCESSSSWTTVARTWVADSASTLIEVRSMVPNSWAGILVDDIRVTLVACPGDVTGNEEVDGIDLCAVLQTWGTNGQAEFDCDTNDDGLVDGADLANVFGGWGACP